MSITYNDSVIDTFNNWGFFLLLDYNWVLGCSRKNNQTYEYTMPQTPEHNKF